jgi:DNA-binding MarR family transcriptional regulator
MKTETLARPAPALAHPAFSRGLGHKAAAKAIRASRPLDVVDLDPVIHERTRLSILTVLFTSREPGCSFSDLRDTLSLTDGNLLAHLRTLEQAEFIGRIKAGAGRNSSTTIQLSSLGKRAFRKYLDQLETLVRAAKGA